MSNHIIGERVRIIEDCRDGGTATGAFGTYEGDKPRTVILYHEEHDEFKEIDVETLSQ